MSLCLGVNIMDIKVKKIGIKSKVLSLFLFISLIIFLSSVFLSISSLQKAKTTTLNVGNTILLEQSKEYYKSYLISQKETLQLLIQTIEDDVKNLRAYTKKLYENYLLFNTKQYWNHEEHLIHLPNNQLIEKETDKSTLWSPTWMNVNKKVLEKIEISAYLNEYFEPLLNRNDNTIANYFLGKEGFLRYYPRVNMLDLFPSDFSTIDDIYFLPATPKYNPEKKLKWTPLYKDPAGQGLMISAIAPVYVENDFIGVVGTDMTLNKLVNSYIKENETRYSILLDENFKPIALPTKALKDIYNKDKVDEKLISKSLLTFDSNFKEVFNLIKNDNYGFKKVVLSDKVIYLNFVRLDSLNWIYANVLNEEELLSVTNTLEHQIDNLIDDLIKSSTLAIVILLIILIFIILYLINRFLSPILKLTEVTKTISQGNIDEEININAKDEIKILIDNFKSMQESIIKQQKELKVFNEELQLKVYERTEELEESNTELQSTINNLKLMQEQLIESEKMASLGGLVAGVAHEINTPVGIGLTGATHLIDVNKRVNKKYEKNELSEEEFKSFLDDSNNISIQIVKNLERTAGLIRSFKQVAVDQSSEEKREFELVEYLKEILLSLDSVINKTKVKIDIEIEEKIWINSYAGAYSQIFTNLIINSMKHAYEDDEVGSIIIRVVREEEIIKIEYKDDGKGIPKKNMKKIFDPFFTTNKEKGGTGLGLNIIYNLVTSTLQGNIKCESIEKEGTIFTITIPNIFKD